MNELTKSLPQIEAEINILKVQTAQNIIEIGKRLIEAKKQLSHGEWGSWLKEKVEFSWDTANNFMRVAREFPNSETLRNLNTSKIYALLSLPAEEREEFVAVNPVEDMTTRELQQAIKENKALKNQIAELENRPPQIIEKEKIVVPGDYEQAKRRFTDLSYQVQSREIQIKQLQEQLKDSKDGLELKKQIEFLSKQKSDLSRQIQSATELSKLTVRLHDVLKQELAPIKFSRCMEQLDKSETAINNLTEVTNLVREWLREIEQYLPSGDFDYIEGEVIR